MRVLHVKHQEGPDGSLYATVNRPPEEPPQRPQPHHPVHKPAGAPGLPNSPASGPPQCNGPAGLHDGPLTRSADSGISSTLSQGLPLHLHGIPILV